MKKSLSFLVFFTLAFSSIAQIPSGYYQGTENLEGTALRAALHEIIDNHTSVSYTSLWTHFQQTDKKANGKVWDMYSDVPGGTPPYEFTFGSDQCGNYGQESDCYNREHSWPQSWFNSQSPMTSDLFHLYPTDGYVNGRRSNYPFGEVGTATWTSQNGSKVGTCDYPGYSGTVFEPIDAYKGDFARTYFYMSTRYYTEDSGWETNGMVDGADLEPWAKNMLMEWHVNDPVSTKEINRNNAVYAIQQNRNPFIDEPEFAHLIFADTYPAPVIDPFQVDTAYETQNYELVILGSDPQGLAIQFEPVELPGWLQWSADATSLVLSGSPSASDYGNHVVSFTYRNAYSMPEILEFEIFADVLTLQEEALIPSWSVYPNPAASEVRFEGLSSQNLKRIWLSDQQGRILKEINLNSSSIPVSDFPSGFYFLNLEGTHFRDQKMIVVQ